MTEDKFPDGSPATPTPATPSNEAEPSNSSEPSTDSTTSSAGTPPRSGSPRRRGRRGGRNRNRSSATPSNAGARASESNDTPLDTDIEGDWRSPEADRGLTSDDIATDAREDAGLISSDKPKIGDSRPAPQVAIPEVVSEPKPARRRRRGGRGRGSSQTNNPNTSSPTPARTDAPDDVVRSDYGEVSSSGLDDLDEATLARRKGRTRKGRPAGRYTMCVHVRDNGHVHTALLEGRVLIEHSVSGAGDPDTSIDGNIYLGRVQNVLPGMEAAFVDIATPKNGVIYTRDVAWDRNEFEGQTPKIEGLLKNGQNVIVQVTKNPIGAKGARLTQEVSLSGRFVVMVPNASDTYGISKRLPDNERKRLRRILDGLRPPDAGLIVRTAAEGASADELERDIQRLRQQWEQISELAKRSNSPRLLYQEPTLVLRLLREEFTKEYRGVVVDNRELYEEVKTYIEAVTPELSERIEYYDEEAEGISVFEHWHVQEQLLKALDRKVWLPSGGSLIVERTEALTVIDVNTGKNVGKSNLEETVYRNNLEAAAEVARQLRLRDIGGIIVIDFIDMEIRANRIRVTEALREALARDKTRTEVFEISDLGLVEMTRKRVSEGLIESMSQGCPTCDGRGYVLDETMLAEMQ